MVGNEPLSEGLSSPSFFLNGMVQDIAVLPGFKDAMSINCCVNKLKKLLVPPFGQVSETNLQSVISFYLDDSIDFALSFR